MSLKIICHSYLYEVYRYVGVKDILPESKNAQAALNELCDCDFLLGKDWHVIDSMSQEQVNALIITDIKQKYKAVNIIAYNRKHPTEFIEIFIGCKLSWWQKIFIKYCRHHR